jgi:hypothetical protein
MGGEMTVAHSQQAVLCPQCCEPKVDFVFLPEGGAHCVECNDSDMLTVVARWRAGEIQDTLAQSLERYVAGDII